MPGDSNCLTTAHALLLWHTSKHYRLGSKVIRAGKTIMRYKAFGKTGIQISALGFGCMRLPMIKAGGQNVVDVDKVIEMVHRAHALGVNYFDTAYFYCNGLSEAALGKALKGIREKVYVSTKSPGHLLKKPGDYRRLLEEQLQRLECEYIDFYHFHGIGFENFHETDKRTHWLSEAVRAREEGLIRRVSFSFHDRPENMVKLIDLGLFTSVLCQYNAIDRSNEASLAYASARGLGTVVMGPLGGGRVSGLPGELAARLGVKVRSSAELALRFVFSNPHIDCALSGMENLAMLEENAAVASRGDPLSQDEVKAINDMMEENAKLAQLYCTGCGYCLPCPAQVNIPHIFRMMNNYRIYGIKEYARKGYADIGVNEWIPGNKADACTECGLCETKCPQKLPIRAQLKESHQALSGC